MGITFFLVFVYLIITIFSSYILDTNTCSCGASSALYTLTQLGEDFDLFELLSNEESGIWSAHDESDQE